MFRLLLQKILCSVLILCCGVGAALAKQSSYEPTAENLKAREWFQDAKFGVFIHWGVSSSMAGGGRPGASEWIMEYQKIPIDKYERMASYFNPTEFDAEEWVKAFKSAGAKYVTFTAKHHDGFAMFDSKVTDYDIVDRTQFKRDIVKELKEACDKYGLKLFFYYSQLDWHHPDYYPRGETGNAYTGRPEAGDWDKYIDFQNAQLKELLTNYGEVGGVWFDGWWDHKDTDYSNKWRLNETYELIHKLQPQALVINNHHAKTPFPGEDVQPFEQDLPGQNHSGFNTQDVSQNLPLEMAQTMNGAWGFNLIDDGFKSTKELIQTLVRAAGSNSNYLMNTGPMPNGLLQPENIQTYKEMGEWMNIYGDSIYGTRGGPISPRSWGVTTIKKNKLYVHVLDWKDELLFVPTGELQVQNARLLRDGRKIKFEQTIKGTTISIPKGELSEWDTVIVFDLVTN